MSNSHDVRNIEERIGTLSEEYTCDYCNVSGILYVGSDAIFFFGLFFLFDMETVLKWVDIRRVQKSHQGVSIVTSNGVSHDFVNMHNPDRVWAFLVSLHNDALLDRKLFSPRSREKLCRRRNSDPSKKVSLAVQQQVPELPLAPLALFDPPIHTNSKTGKISGKSREVEAIVGKVSHQFRCNYANQRGVLFAGPLSLYFVADYYYFFFNHAKVTIEWQDIRQVRVIHNGIVILTTAGISHSFLNMRGADRAWATLMSIRNESLKNKPPQPTTIKRTYSEIDLGSLRNLELLSPDDVPYPTETSDSEESQEMGIPQTPSSAPCEQTDESNAPDLAIAWANAINKNDNNIIVHELELQCSLDTFFKSFVADNAEYRVSQYMTKHGELDVTESLWEQSKVSGDGGQSRVITYTHAVNSPLAPPTAQARKEQVYRRFGEHGLLVETKTFVEDLPLTDCFYIVDYLVVDPKGETKVSLTMGYDLQFTKPTMFRNLITRSVKTDMTKFLQGWAAFTTQSLSGVEEQMPKAEPQIVIDKVPEQKTTRPERDNVIYGLFFFIALLQCLILWQLVQLNSLKDNTYFCDCTNHVQLSR